MCVLVWHMLLGWSWICNKSVSQLELRKVWQLKHSLKEFTGVVVSQDGHVLSLLC